MQSQLSLSKLISWGSLRHHMFLYSKSSCSNWYWCKNIAFRRFKNNSCIILQCLVHSYKPQILFWICFLVFQLIQIDEGHGMLNNLLIAIFFRIVRTYYFVNITFSYPHVEGMKTLNIFSRLWYLELTFWFVCYNGVISRTVLPWQSIQWRWKIHRIQPLHQKFMLSYSRHWRKQ